MGFYDQKFGAMLYDAGGAVVNVRNPKYGAKPDGSTNNTTAFTNALADLQAAGGGTLLIPAGTNFYDLPAGLSLSGLSVPIVIRGAGYGSWLHATGIDVFMLCGSNQNIRFENFRFTGSVSRIIQLETCFNIQMRNLHLSGATRVQAGAPTAAVYMNNICSHILCDRLALSGNGYIEAGSGNPRGFEILANTAGIHDNIRVTRCRIDGANTEASVLLYNTNNSLVDLNRIAQGNHGAATSMGHAVAFLATGGPSACNRVSGNRIDNCAMTGVAMTGQHYSSVTDNLINGATFACYLTDFNNSICSGNVGLALQYGVAVQQTIDSIVAANRIICTQYGCYLIGAVNVNVLVHGNRISGGSTGIYETAGNAFCSVVDNDVTGNTNPLQLLATSGGGQVANNQGHNPPSSVSAVAGAYTVGKADEFVLVNGTAGPVTVTLPDCAKYPGREIMLKRVDGVVANAVTLNSAGGTIDFAATNTELNANLKFIRVRSQGALWAIIGRG